MSHQRLPEPGAGQAPIDHEELASIERALRDATGNSLAELHRKRVAEMLLKKP